MAVPSVGDQEHQRLRNEYHQTIRVLSVLAAALLAKSDSELTEILEIHDAALLKAPDIEAWRDNERRMTCIRVIPE